MRTTIDRAGRLVVPKPLRDQLGLTGGATVDVSVDGDRLVVEATSPPMRFDRKRGRIAVDDDIEMPPLSPEDVRAVVERVRR